MMDIVERIKLSPKNSLMPYKWAVEAADEIERLREALTNLDSAINQWSSTDSMVKKTLLKLIADALKEGE